MSSNESFKRRIRERMAKTGERYTAARRVLIKKSPKTRRPWVSEPETGDDAVLLATKRSWDDWCDLIDRWPEHSEDHAKIAAYLQRTHALDAWWAQTVTVGYERITGLRLPYQRPDGTFSAGRSRTVNIVASELRAMLLNDDERSHLFPGHTTILRSKLASKVIRIAIGPGVAQIGIEARTDDRVKVSVIHEKLPEFGDVEEWKFYWSEWLAAIDQSSR